MSAEQPETTGEVAREVERAVEEVVRTARPRLVAWLAGQAGDLAAAEDALGDAVVAALRTWPDGGVPERPDAWLLTAARRVLLDAARRRDVARRALPSVVQVQDERAEPPLLSVVPDTRLELLFVCAHPAIDRGVRSPLMLQAVLGLDAERIGAAFLVPGPTMGQRLVRAKTKIRAAGVPFRLPERAELPGRLESVLEAVYGCFTAGWDDVSGTDARAGGLEAEAVRLARLVVELLPEEPEALGLLALLLHTRARAAARLDDDGAFVPLQRQDPGRWDRALVTEAEGLLDRAQRMRRLGPYQLQAAIASVHNRRAATGSTAWPVVAALYDGLVALRPTLGAAVARAAAHREVSGAAPALRLLDELPADRVRGYQPYWTLRAHVLADLGDDTAARDAAATARRLTADPAVLAHLEAALPAG